MDFSHEILLCLFDIPIGQFIDLYFYEKNLRVCFA